MSKAKLEKEIETIKRAIATKPEQTTQKLRQAAWEAALDKLPVEERKALDQAVDVMLRYNPDLLKEGTKQVMCETCHGYKFLKTVPNHEMPQYWMEKLTPEEKQIIERQCRIYMKLNEQTRKGMALFERL